MSEPIYDQPTTLANDYLESTFIDAAMYKDAYDLPSLSPKSNSSPAPDSLALSGVEPTFAEESAFRIMKDLKAIDDARKDQETFLSFPVLAGSAGLALAGLLTEIPTFGASTVMVMSGVSAFAYSISRALDDGTDWKNAADDMNSVFDELLERQKEGDLSAHDVERFATLMHNLPVDSLKDILDEGQEAKYKELIAGAAKKDA